MLDHYRPGERTMLERCAANRNRVAHFAASRAVLLWMGLPGGGLQERALSPLEQPSAVSG